MDIHTILLETIQTIVGTAITVGIGYIVAYVRNHISVQDLQTKKELAKAAVLFVEQVYKTVDGQSKFIKAENWLIQQIQHLGLKVAPDEIKGLIESALKEIKMEFETQINQTTTQTTEPQPQDQTQVAKAQ
jgi:LL-H family phage holin